MNDWKPNKLKELIFHADLDNTLIYSYKHDIGKKRQCVEIYQNREISYMTDESVLRLKQAVGLALFVPTTTRTIEQYHRITFPVQVPKYALVCNGGVLLEDGEIQKEWYEESKDRIKDAVSDLKRACGILEADKNRCFEVRDIMGLFLFTKSRMPKVSAEYLRKLLDPGQVDVFCNGIKVYVMPKQLSKGIAVERFRKKRKNSLVIAAGDSEFDISMLKQADIAIAPYGLLPGESGKVQETKTGEKFDKRQSKQIKVLIKETELFSDALLSYIADKASGFADMPL